MANEKVVPEWPVIGIDLGTTYSCVAVWRNGHAEIILNDVNQRLTPSSVAFAGGELLVGEAAKNQITSNPQNTIYDVKRLIGRRYSDVEVQSDIRLWSFQVDKTEKDEPRILVQDKDEEKILTAQEISSMVLQKLKSSAEEYLGREVKNAVITVPAYFNDSQRRATKDAGRVAGLKVVRVINEPTAAALAYAQDEQHRSNEKKKVLIFDLGGGTFDVSIVEINGPQFNVKATQGDTHLGGEDFDNRMVEHLAEKFEKDNNIDITEHPKPLRRLRKEWEKMKRSLSSQKAVIINIEALHMERDFSMRITRAKFEELNKDLFRKCLGPVEKCLADAALTKKDINEVVLVGGSSRIPKIQQILKDFFDGKRELCHIVNPDEAVALGAAIQGAILSGVADSNIAHLQVKDVTPLALGIDDGGNMRFVVNRCTPIPIRVPTTCCTSFHNQTEMTFQVYEGERGIAKENHHLGNVVLEGITSARAGEVKVELIFDVDEDGILTVIATDKTSGKQTETKITNDAGRLSDEEIQKMIKEADRWRPHDNLQKKRLYARNELEARLNDMTNKLNENPSLLKRKMSEVTYNRVKAFASELKEWMDRNASDANYDELDKKKKELKKMQDLVSPPFS